MNCRTSSHSPAGKEKKVLIKPDFLFAGLKQVYFHGHNSTEAGSIPFLFEAFRTLTEIIKNSFSVRWITKKQSDRIPIRYACNLTIRSNFREYRKSFNLLGNRCCQDIGDLYVNCICVGGRKYISCQLHMRRAKNWVWLSSNHVTCPEYRTPKFIWPHQFAIYANKWSKYNHIFEGWGPGPIPPKRFMRFSYWRRLNNRLPSVGIFGFCHGNCRSLRPDFDHKKRLKSQ